MMDHSSDDEIARDTDNVQNKIPGRLGDQLNEIKEAGMNSRRVKMFESELKGTMNHKFSFKRLIKLQGHL